MYTVATVAAGTVAGVTVTVGAATVKLYACVPEYGPVPVEESVVLMVNDIAPPCVGVPVSKPVVAFNVMPAGNEPAEIVNVYGAVPPLAVSCCEYATPITGAGSVACVIATLADAMVTVYAWAA